jgi:hypothetical protein
MSNSTSGHCPKCGFVGSMTIPQHAVPATGLTCKYMTERTSRRTVMPIMGSTLMSEIPFSMLAPHEEQAQRNHGQSLNRLAERGGLAVSEAIDILEGRKWNSAANCIENDRYLINKVRAWRAAIGLGA